MNMAQSKTGEGLVVRMTPEEFDRLGAVGRYVGMLPTDEGRTIVIALVIEEEKAA